MIGVQTCTNVYFIILLHCIVSKGNRQFALLVRRRITSANQIHAFTCDACCVAICRSIEGVESHSSSSLGLKLTLTAVFFVALGTSGRCNIYWWWNIITQAVIYINCNSNGLSRLGIWLSLSINVYLLHACVVLQGPSCFAYWAPPCPCLFLMCLASTWVVCLVCLWGWC